MKKLLCVFLVLIVLVAAVPVVKLVRLTVVNRSDEPVYLKFQEVTWDTVNPVFVNLTAAGDSLPAVGVFTFTRGVYDIEARYCGLDWVTYFKGRQMNKSLDRFVIPPCDQKVESDGDGVLKLSPWLYPPVDLLERPIIYDLGGFRYRY